MYAEPLSHNGVRRLSHPWSPMFQSRVEVWSCDVRVAMSSIVSSSCSRPKSCRCGAIKRRYRNHPPLGAVFVPHMYHAGASNARPLNRFSHHRKPLLCRCDGEWKPLLKQRTWFFSLVCKGARASAQILCSRWEPLIDQDSWTLPLNLRWEPLLKHVILDYNGA